MLENQNKIVAAVTPDYKKANHWSLVLLAANISHSLIQSPNGWTICVSSEQYDKAHQEIKIFERENSNWPPPKIDSATHSYAKDQEPPTIFMMGLMMIFYTVTGPWAWKSDWFQVGAISRLAIVNDGEWWRLLTALTLHADPVHLFGNAIIGGMIVHFLCKEIGGGIGWSLIFLSGILGNWLNIYWRVGEHLSVGFSTSVFGAVGCLCGLSIARLSNFKQLLLPLGAAGGLLALLGTSGERTDLGAHFWGLVCGIFLAAAIARVKALKKWSVDRYVQFLPVLWIGIIALVWYAALKQF